MCSTDRKWKFRLRHMREAIDKILRYTAGMTESQSFMNELRRQSDRFSANGGRYSRERPLGRRSGFGGRPLNRPDADFPLYPICARFADTSELLAVSGEL